ncbi:LPS export ABC transporter permease LptG [Roseiterribacter gracilis]|uniref:LPS export ABC transporter permease LptG n=1 Tax=Roseiterribacter gracilis TaxID=2812848 RepID=A0A8S8X7W5_9PROT|nr:LPS export ABC transporter permease LptG [Rhodospirillales bacterium TMPK1]
MNLSPTVARYVSRQFILHFAAMITVLLTIVYLVDSLELLRRASKRPDITVGSIFQMSILKLPLTGQELFPFAVLFAAMYTFWRLTRTSELVVLRSVGVSAWQFLMPALLGAFAIGLVKVALINPAGSVLIQQYERLDNQFLRGKTSAVNLSAQGLWLRQVEDDRPTIIHARSVQGDWELKDVIVFFFDKDRRFTGRLDGPAAKLDHGKWIVREGTLSRLAIDGTSAQSRVHDYAIPTDLTRDEIEDSFSSPDSLSFWSMPRFIQTMESTGFSATRLKLHYQSLLAQPLLFAGLVLVAAAASLGPLRRHGALKMMGVGVLAAFALFFLNNVIRALGLSETIPVPLAAWAPALIATIGGFATLLYLEDG